VGGVIGGVAVIIIVIVVILVRRKKRSPNDTTEKRYLQTTELRGYSLPDELDGNPRRNELSGSSRYVLSSMGIDRITLLLYSLLILRHLQDPNDKCPLTSFASMGL
jgi:hypothetical protein